jgi:hypothetical protein
MLLSCKLHRATAISSMASEGPSQQGQGERSGNTSVPGLQEKLNSMVRVRERTIPTLVGEVNANFCG